MPAWITWKLFWKIAPYVGAILLVLGAIWYLDRQGYQRAQRQNELAQARQAAADERLQRVIDQRVSTAEQRMQTIVNTQSQQLRASLDSIDVQERTIIQPTITREIQNAPPRIRDPAAGITPGMLDALNAARRGTTSPSASGANR